MSIVHHRVYVFRIDFNWKWFYYKKINFKLNLMKENFDQNSIIASNFQ